MAGRTRDPAGKRIMLEIARSYDDLAAWAERSTRPQRQAELTGAPNGDVEWCATENERERQRGISEPLGARSETKRHRCSMSQRHQASTSLFAEAVRQAESSATTSASRPTMRVLTSLRSVSGTLKASSVAFRHATNAA